MTKSLPLAVIGAVLGAALLGGGTAAAAPAKEDVCHQTGNESYVKISVSAKAVPAHLDHGDVLAGTPGVVDQDCNAVTRVTSSTLSFGPNGWGGWSCPAGMTAVGGGTTLVSTTAQGVAEPGATIGGSTYPVFPHYTFSPGETGYVVQNDNDSESGEIFVDCV